MTKHRRRTMLGVLVIGVIIMIAAGCGKKADPMPLKMTPPKAPLNATVALGTPGQGLTLMWELDPAVKPERFRIIRSEIETSGLECIGCPRIFSTLTERIARDPLFRWEGERRIRYQDTTVKPGWLYSYRIILCTEDGYCSEPSEICEIKYDEGTAAP